MTNEEWLEHLAHNDIPGLRAWFKAEHVESPESGALVQCAQIDGEGRERAAEDDTEPQNADSRELLDADVRKWCGEYAYQADMVWTWLNRQAAITEEKTRYKWVTASAEEIAAWRSKAEKLKEQVYELTAERDELTQQLDTLRNQRNAMARKLRQAENDRDRYRAALGKAIDCADEIRRLS
ncbi:MAG: hypothetical protein IIZ12_03225 [Eggerthellaceae bacterium]|nr:hypothetical protein [Eggerthellaceae bacterium]